MREWCKVRLIDKELEKKIDNLPEKIGLELNIKYTFGEMTWEGYIEQVNKYYAEDI